MGVEAFIEKRASSCPPHMSPIAHKLNQMNKGGAGYKKAGSGSGSGSFLTKTRRESPQAQLKNKMAMARALMAGGDHSMPVKKVGEQGRENAHALLDISPTTNGDEKRFISVDLIKGTSSGVYILYSETCFSDHLYIKTPCLQ